MDLLCRLCGNSVENEKNPAHKIKFKNDINLALGIDVNEDPDRIPDFLCNSCRCKLIRWRKNKNLNRASYKLNIKLCNFDDSTNDVNTDVDTVKLDKAAVLNGFIFSHSTDATREYIKIYGNEIVLRVSVCDNGKWTAHIHDTDVKCNLVSSYALPSKLLTSDLELFFGILGNVAFCSGNNDFLDVCRNISAESLALFYGADGSLKAYEEEKNLLGRTVRTVNCKLICSTSDKRCEVCRLFRPDLVKKRSRLNYVSTKFINNKYLTAKQLQSKCEQQKSQISSLKRKLSYFEEKVEKNCLENGVFLDNDLGNAFKDILHTNEQNALENFNPDSPQYILWQQQKDGCIL